MDPRRPHTVTTCVLGASGCESFRVGHVTHTVQVTLAGTTPRHWRRAVVEEVDRQVLTLRLEPDGGHVVAWHHAPLDRRVENGMPLRVHADRGLLEIGTDWISVALSDVER